MAAAKAEPTRTCWRPRRSRPSRRAAEAEAAAEEAPAEEEAPRKRKGKAADEEAEADDGDADAEVAEEAEATSPSRRRAAAPGTGLNVAFVLRMFSRNFAYNESIKGGQQGYQAPEKRFNNLPLVPAPGLALEYFPATYAGVFANFNYGIAGSKDTGRQRLQDQRLLLDDRRPRAASAVGSMDLEPSVGYGSHVFKVDDFSTAPTASRSRPSTTGTSAPAAASACRSASAASWPAATTCTSSAPATSSATSTSRATPSAARCSPAPSSPSASSRAWISAPGLDFRRIAFAFTPAARCRRPRSPAAPSTSTSA